MTASVVVFDIGGVLVEWQPHLAWMDALGSREAVEAFMARVDFAARNHRADAGERFADLAAEVDDAEDARLLEEYVVRHPLSVPRAIEGSWALLERLRARGVPVHSITNWSAETWPGGLSVHPRLGTAFGVTVVSGQEGIAKPDPRIFGLFCARAGVAPGECVFVDDSEANVAAARAVGMDGIRFTGPEALERALAERGLL
jgi:HAD superfamily hydrolase (TIGR01509 family)